MEKELCKVVPSDRKERIKILDNAINILKTEFVGLDDILDQIKESISSWYITPEVNTRPVVISLWGMTGTGKSSVVRRLINLLGINNFSMYFDCGECQRADRNITDEVCETLGLDQDNFSNNEEKFVFVFDEFQHARSIDSSGSENIKPTTRPIWSILDSGLLYINNSYSWEYNKLIGVIDDLISLNKNLYTIEVVNNKVKDPDAVKSILNSIGFLQYPERLYQNEPDNDLEKKIDPYRPLSLINPESLRYMIRNYNLVESGSGEKIMKSLVEGKKTLGEIIETLKEVKSFLKRPKEVNCSKSLVFVIGNLDEAFWVSGDTNPDMSADTFYDITSKVTISDIKEALKSRFRPEQIARLGNNLIKYPTLRESDFRKIIRLELDKIINKFNKEVDPIEITITKDIEDLLYSEGVYPTQGVRPIFTTINTIVAPYLSRILIEKSSSSSLINKVEIGIDNLNLYKFKVPEITIYLKFSNKDIEVSKKTYIQNLQLGAIRDPRNRHKRYICSVHEIGHAIVYTKLTGNIPDNIVSVSTDRGGFCSTYNKDTSEEIKSREDIDNEVCISLGGYLAEKLIFDYDKCLMGSGSDLSNIWVSFINSVCRSGYFEPSLAASWEMGGSVDPIPAGLDINSIYVPYHKKDNNFDYIPLKSAIERKLEELKAVTENILNEEINLLVKSSLVLGERGSLTAEEFKQLIKDYGNTLTLDNIEEIKRINDPKYYLENLLNNYDGNRK